MPLDQSLHETRSSVCKDFVNSGRPARPRRLAEPSHSGTPSIEDPKGNSGNPRPASSSMSCVFTERQRNGAPSTMEALPNPS
jgi:hypothetical protein